MGKKTKNKENLTPTQLKKKYKKIQYACFGGQFASVITPFVVIGIVNFDKYFVQYDGTKMSIAAVMAAALMGLAVWLVAKRKFTNSYITLIVGWAMVTAIFFLLGQVINDIAYIMLFGLIGLLGAEGLDIASARASKEAEKIQKAIDSAETDIVKEAYLEEQKAKNETRKIKIKVKEKE